LARFEANRSDAGACIIPRMKSYRMVLRAGNFTCVEPGQEATWRGMPGRINCAKIVVGYRRDERCFRHAVMDEGGDTWSVSNWCNSGSRQEVPEGEYEKWNHRTQRNRNNLWPAWRRSPGTSSFTKCLHSSIITSCSLVMGLLQVAIIRHLSVVGNKLLASLFC
jgi:hypothetical protein